MLDHFPDGFSPRKEQVEIIRRIEDAVSSGYPAILLCAPTGIGKSHIAATFARSFGSSHIITAQKALQDQYSEDFHFLSSLKGKSNFACRKLYDMSGQRYRGGISRNYMTCDHGLCSWYEMDGRKATCEYKPKKADFQVETVNGETVVFDPPDSCYYYGQKYAAMLSPHTLYNYASYFSLRRFVTSNDIRRDCLVADEAHDIENQLVSFAACTITRSHVEDAGFRWGEFPVRDLDTLRVMVATLLMRYNSMTRRTGRDHMTLPQQLVTQERLNSIYNELTVRPENVAWTVRGDAVMMKPIDMRSLMMRYFDAPCNLFMSATIHPEVFCSEMGIDPRDCAYVETKKSPFLPERRRVDFLDIARLGHGSPAESYASVYTAAAGLLRRHRNEKGLILTTSRQQCRDIMPYLDPVDRERMIVAHAGFAGGQPYAVKKHREAEGPTVLLSPSLWFGVDLKDDLSRFQIILKAPYLSLGDERTNAKNKRNPVWYQYAALVRLLQGMGRSVRTERDHAITYVLDSAAHDLVRKMRNYVPPSYAEVLA